MRKISRVALLCILPLIPARMQLENARVLVPVEYMVGTSTKMSATFLKDFWDYFESNLERIGSPGAAVAIVKDDQLVFLKGFGTKKSGKNSTEMLVGPNTLFRIGSLSKGFAGLLAAKLIEEQYFEWDDRVQSFLPEFQLLDSEQASRIAVRHLLSHTTGLARHAYTNLTEGGMELKQILPNFSSVPVFGKEGQYYAYQNTAFSMIESVMAQTTDLSYNELLDAKIFQPAGMIHASSTYEEIKTYQDVAQPHQYWSAQGRYVSTRLNRKYFNAVSAGGVNASIGDMAQWMQVLLGNVPEVATQETLDVIFTPVIETRRSTDIPRWPGLKSASYGMGWRILHFKNRTLAYHGGSVNDYRSEIAIDRENRIGICVLFNAQNRLASRVLPTFFKKYDEFVWEAERLRYVAKS